VRCFRSLHPIAGKCIHLVRTVDYYCHHLGSGQRREPRAFRQRPFCVFSSPLQELVVLTSQ
jgi:hypothetical protein